MMNVLIQSVELLGQNKDLVLGCASMIVGAAQYSRITKSIKLTMAEMNTTENLLNDLKLDREKFEQYKANLEYQKGVM